MGDLMAPRISSHLDEFTDLNLVDNIDSADVDAQSITSYSHSTAAYFPQTNVLCELRHQTKDRVSC